MSDLLQPGQLFAERYRIERFLAKGGFGAVYVAEQLATELRVALKVLFPHVLGSTDAVDKFQQEARIAGRLNSEHIVRVIDAGFDQATEMPFLVMELLQGQDLEQVVQRSGALPAERVLSYLRQAASGLDKAHGYVDRDGKPAPIIHRDLKPENLFLGHREDGSPMIKVLDFGIAKVLSASTKVSQEVKGTPLFMAFEQASSGAITPRTDVWALGLIAFYLLAGRNYWRAANRSEGTLTELFGEVLAMPLLTASERAVELGVTPPWPAAFDAWFTRCVNRDASQRFGSAGEAASALARVFGAPEPEIASDAFSVTVFAPPSQEASPSTASRVPTLESERPPAAPVGSGTDTKLAVGRTTDVPVRRRTSPLALGIGVLALALVGAGATVAFRSSPATTAEPPAQAVPARSPTSATSVSVVPTVAEAPAPVAPSSTAAAAAPSATAPPSTTATSRRPTAEPRKPPRDEKPAPKPAAPKGPDEVYGER